MKRFYLAALLLALAPFSFTFAQDEVLTQIRGLGPRDVKMDGFVLDKDQEISINGVGAGNHDDFLTNAWILNAQTREVVWKMRNAKRSRWNRGLVEYNDLVSLPKGQYEVYYAAFPDQWGNFEGFGDFMGYLADKLFDWDHDNRAFRDLSLTIRGSGKHLGSEGVEQFHEQLKHDALVAFTGLWDNDYVRQGFTLEKPMDIHIYTIGELRDDGTYDYGWIINTKTGEKVWKMTYRNTTHAGGDRKNRTVNSTLTLPAGTYAMFFVTDGSHSYRDWNAPPPYDPPFWGITLRVADPSLKKFAKLFDYKGAEEKNVIADLTRLRDREYSSKGFALSKPMDIRVYALGEGTDHRMHDYGWIIDAKTHKKVWVMEYEETEHAGGADKNRMVDKIIHLDKGTYMVYFVTDGSHSYRDWNSSAPFDPEHWGITISGVGEKFNPKDAEVYEEKDDSSVLARIVGVRDDDRRRQQFMLSKKSDVRIYAIGEGRDGDMFDYAWIEDANTGKVMWEMTYQMTEHAGGADKNRLFDGTISLPSGKYVLYYQTDDSHSFEDWNDDPPLDPSSWGVTLSLAESKHP